MDNCCCWAKSAFWSRSSSNSTCLQHIQRTSNTPGTPHQHPPCCPVLMQEVQRPAGSPVCCTAGGGPGTAGPAAGRGCTAQQRCCDGQGAGSGGAAAQSGAGPISGWANTPGGEQRWVVLVPLMWSKPSLSSHVHMDLDVWAEAPCWLGCAGLLARPLS